MKLRYYQEQAVQACYQWMGDNAGNPVIVLPTGAGKTLVIAKICQDVHGWGGRVLVLAHVKELLEQAYNNLRSIGSLDVGIYSASLKSRSKENDITIAGIHSVYSKGFELCGSRPYNVIIVDEAHRIPLNGDGMYRSLLGDIQKCNPKVRMIGFTATPYRLDSGLVCGKDSLLNDICYSADIRELIAGGFLCPLIGKRSFNDVEMDGVGKGSNGDFQSSEMQDRFLEGDKVRQSVREIVQQSRNRRKVLIFASGVQHAAAIKFEFDRMGLQCGVIVGETEGKTRRETINKFRDHDMKYLVNVNCLTEGFDATSIDVVALLRSTLSPGLYYQMVGRGLRVNASKTDCLVLDFGGNIKRHGPIDCLNIERKLNGGSGEAPVKCCDKCGLIVHAGVRQCECGYEFPPPELKHDTTASTDQPLSDSIQEWEIDSVDYEVHTKRSDPNAPKTMRVTYNCKEIPICSEWICCGHSGFAYEKAWAWWNLRSNHPMPRNAEDAVSMAPHVLAIPSSIKIRKPSGEKFYRIVSYKLGEKPAAREPGDDGESIQEYIVDGISYEVPF